MNKVTLKDVMANIDRTDFFTASQGVSGSRYVIHNPNIRGPLDRLTFCVLTLKSGFTVTGQSSCVSDETFDEAVGRDLAEQKAIDKVWELMGYELSVRLAQQKRIGDLATATDSACEEVATLCPKASGWKFLKDTTHAERSWPDKSYSCACSHCGRSFIGDKHSVTCRACSEFFNRNRVNA